MIYNSFKLLLETVNDPTLQWLDQLYKEATEIQQTRGLADEAKFDYIKMQLGSKSAPQGSARMVMKFNEGYVIKVALNAAGFAQNGMEATIGNDPAAENVVVPVVNWSDIADYDGFFWILSKRAIPLSDSLVGKDWTSFVQYLKKAATSDDPISPQYPEDTKIEIPLAAAEKRKKETQPLRQGLKKEPSEIYKHLPPEFFDYFRDFLKRYSGARTADIFKPDSWGIVDNQLKLIDYGYTKRISDDFYASGYFAGSAKAKQKSTERMVQRSKNIIDTLAGNVDTLSNIKSVPANMTILLLLKGIVLGLPSRIENFNLGDSVSSLTPAEKAGVVKVLRNNEKKIDSIIRQVSDPDIRSKAQDEFEELLLSQGALKANEALIRRLVIEILSR